LLILKALFEELASDLAASLLIVNQSQGKEF
jgi:hypothetical protein